MPKKNEIFERLAQSARAKNFFDNPTFHPIAMYERVGSTNFNRPPVGRAGTLERFADDLRMPLDLLIDQFDRAGITRLRAEDHVSRSAKDALLAYLRATHGAASASKTAVLYVNENPPATQIEVVQDANEELIRLLAVSPQLMYGLNPRKFEEIVALLFEKRGFRVTLTPQSKDGGFDFFVELRNPMSSFLVLGECKRYRQDRKVGVEVVRGLHSVTETQGANQGLVITSSFFTAGAVDYQRILGSKMGLKDYDHLVGWLRGIGNAL